MKKVSILALHMGFGGVEHAISSLANMMSDDYDVEIVSLYKIPNDCPFYLNDKVKVTYLTNFYPNKDELKKAIKSKRIIKALEEGIKALYIFSTRRYFMKKHLKNNKSDIIISSRVLFHDLAGKYSYGAKTIAQEHRHHNNDQKYIKKVVNSVKDVDYLMPVSKELTNFYGKYVGGKAIYIKHTIDELPNKFKHKISKKLISIGRLSYEKGVIDLIEMMHLLIKEDSNFTLDIFGDGNERVNIENKIKEYNLENNIKLHGFQKREAINKKLMNSFLFLMASHEESFGLVLVEAMSFGIPCLAFDSAQGAHEIINNKNGSLIKNRNISTMKNNILELFNNHNKVSKMSIEARKTSEEYSFETIKKEWLDFLSNINK